MNIKKLTVKSDGWPDVIQQMEKPPSQLYFAGQSLHELMKRPRVAIVGSRSVSSYGRQTTLKIARELAEQGIVIISGLALGVDALAHKATVEVGGLAIAVLPGPVDKVVPATNRHLSQQIIDQGGALVSEYESGSEPFKQNFVARNRLVSAFSDAILITEAAEKSGSLYTANFALKQGKDVLAVPGNITSPYSVGTNNLIKTGAQPITSYIDVLNILGLKHHKTEARLVKGRNQNEQIVLDLMLRGINNGDKLLDSCDLTTIEFNQVMTMLELGGKIRPLGANQWSIY